MHGGTSHLEIWTIANSKLTNLEIVNPGVISSLIHIDWSTDSKYIAINSDSEELDFILIENTPPKMAIPAILSKDKELDW